MRKIIILLSVIAMLFVGCATPRSSEVATRPISTIPGIEVKALEYEYDFLSDSANNILLEFSNKTKDIIKIDWAQSCIIDNMGAHRVRTCGTNIKFPSPNCLEKIIPPNEIAYETITSEDSLLIKGKWGRNGAGLDCGPMVGSSYILMICLIINKQEHYIKYKIMV